MKISEDSSPKSWCSFCAAVLRVWDLQMGACIPRSTSHHHGVSKKSSSKKSKSSQPNTDNNVDDDNTGDSTSSSTSNADDAANSVSPTSNSNAGDDYRKFIPFYKRPDNDFDYDDSDACQDDFDSGGNACGEFHPSCEAMNCVARLLYHMTPFRRCIENDVDDDDDDDDDTEIDDGGARRERHRVLPVSELKQLLQFLDIFEHRRVDGDDEAQQQPQQQHNQRQFRRQWVGLLVSTQRYFSKYSRLMGSLSDVYQRFVESIITYTPKKKKVSNNNSSNNNHNGGNVDDDNSTKDDSSNSSTDTDTDDDTNNNNNSYRSADANNIEFLHSYRFDRHSPKQHSQFGLGYFVGVEIRCANARQFPARACCGRRSFEYVSSLVCNHNQRYHSKPNYSSTNISNNNADNHSINDYYNNRFPVTLERALHDYYYPSSSENSNTAASWLTRWGDLESPQQLHVPRQFGRERDLDVDLCTLLELPLPRVLCLELHSTFSMSNVKTIARRVSSIPLLLDLRRYSMNYHVGNDFSASSSTTPHASKATSTTAPTTIPAATTTQFLLYGIVMTHSANDDSNHKYDLYIRPALPKQPELWYKYCGSDCCGIVVSASAVLDDAEHLHVTENADDDIYPNTPKYRCAQYLFYLRSDYVDEFK